MEAFISTEPHPNLEHVTLHLASIQKFPSSVLSMNMSNNENNAK